MQITPSHRRILCTRTGDSYERDDADNTTTIRVALKNILFDPYLLGKAGLPAKRS